MHNKPVYANSKKETKLKISLDDRMRILANFMIDKFLEEQKNHLKLSFDKSNMVLDENEDCGTP